MYNVTDEQKNRLIDTIEDELSNRGYDCSVSAIRTIVNEWSVQKNPLLSVFSKHPNWDNEKYMIKGVGTFERTLGSNEMGLICDFYWWVYGTLVGIRDMKLHPEDIEYTTKTLILTSTFDWLVQYSPTNAIIDINRYPFLGILDVFNSFVHISSDFSKYAPKNGVKMSRWIGKIIKWSGLFNKPVEYKPFNMKELKEFINSGIYPIQDEEINSQLIRYVEYEKRFAQFADAINPLKIEYPIYISLNPIDYLLMSNGHSWTSCHDIRTHGDEGCFSSGTISYMFDRPTFIVYALTPGDNPEDPEFEKKVYRQVCGYDGGTLMLSRLYPSGNDGNYSLYDNIRKLLQSVIATCENWNNIWVNKGRTMNNDLIRTVDGSTHYPDYEYDYYTHVCILKDFAIEPTTLYIGAEPICVSCGYSHSYSDSIMCSECSSAYYCADCGRRIDEDDVCWMNGEPYCSDCVTYCEHCGCYEFNNYATYIEDFGYVCEYCRTNSGEYAMCYDCGRYYRVDDMYVVDGEAFCDRCVDDRGGVIECGCCGDYTWNDNAIEAPDGNMYCEYCFNCNFKTCELCGAIYDRDEMMQTITDDGIRHWYCTGCLEEESEVA